MNTDFDCIIVGAGLGGLTAGATLSKQGKRVLLLEKHYIPGGCATTFKRKDFIMEVGLHEMDGLYDKDLKQEIFKFLEVDKNINFIKVPELFRYISNKVDFVHPHGNDKTLKSLSKMYPSDRKGINTFLKLMEGILSELPKYPVEKWKQILIYPVMPLMFPNIVKGSNVSLGDWLDKNINSEELKLIIQASMLYYHDDPYTMSLLYFSAAQSSYINGGGHFIKGGSQKLSNYLSRVIENNGGQVLLGKKVTSIITEKNAVVGVKFSDAFNSKLPETTIHAEKIIANVALPLVKKFLPENEKMILAKEIDHLETACSLLSVYIGFRTEIKSLGNKHYSTFVSGDNVNSIKDIKNNNQGDWEDRNFVFVDYSQIDSQLAPKGKSFGVICTADYLSDWDSLDDESYKAKKDEVAKIFFKRLEKLIPGITNEIEYFEVGTSKTIQRFTMNPEGTPYGYAQTPNQSGNKRPPFQSPIKNLYFAGAWTFPGGGFTGAIISGFLSATMVNKGIKNSISKNSKRIEDHRIVKVLKSVEIAKNTIEITTKKPLGFSYKAGQYVVLEILNAKYKELDIPIRPLSISSHPDDDFLSFAMRLSESSYKKSIHELTTDDSLIIFGPQGDFTVKTNNKGIVFLVSGIGITPIKPLLMELEKNNFQNPIYLMYSNKTEDSTAYHDYFNTIAMKNFNYIPVFTKTQGRIGKELIRATIPSFSDFDYYIVGTNGFVNSMKQILSSCNVTEESIFVDDFG